MKIKKKKIETSSSRASSAQIKIDLKAVGKASIEQHIIK